MRNTVDEVLKLMELGRFVSISNAGNGGEVINPTDPNSVECFVDDNDIARLRECGVKEALILQPGHAPCYVLYTENSYVERYMVDISYTNDPSAPLVL